MFLIIEREREREKEKVHKNRRTGRETDRCTGMIYNAANGKFETTKLNRSNIRSSIK